MTEGKNVPSGVAAAANQPASTDEPRNPLASAEAAITGRPNLVGVIDEGTLQVTFTIYSTPDFTEVATHRELLTMISPQDGWFEQNPMEIIDLIYKCCGEACAKLPALGYSMQDIATVGITNQRETTVMWDTITGLPLYNALVWKDIRSASIVDRVLSKVPDSNKNYFKNISGLPVSPLFSALKIRWLMDNVPEIKKACRERHCKAGTIDSWIVWNLTKGELHITDVTNASRTLLMNIETLNWDPMLLKTFHLNAQMLPEIRSCSEIYGTIKDERSGLAGLPISAMLGNQQASLLGHMCIKPGQAKNTYRSGCFLLCNTGENYVVSQHGLLTTVAYKLGPNARPVYALEGAVAVGGHALRWLENRVRLMEDFNQAEKYAEKVTTTGDVYFVPAFTGLYAPYWRKDARGIIIGLTQFTTKHHIIRAALESICFQTRDILECMYKEGGFKLTKLYADGSLSSNNLLMQLQSDTAGVPVFRSGINTSSLAAAMCAAQADDINLFKIITDKPYAQEVRCKTDAFLPTSTDEERKHRYGKWKRAVERSLNWVVTKNTNIMTEERYKILASIPASLFIMSTFAMLAMSVMRQVKN